MWPTNLYALMFGLKFHTIKQESMEPEAKYIQKMSEYFFMFIVQKKHSLCGACNCLSGYHQFCTIGENVSIDVL